jgi:protein farnesyltransferase subunit beta
MAFEGGFQGRANKLVDSCYTFWQGAAFPLITEIFSGEKLLVSHPAQLYILLAAQAETGGLRDKPGKPADFYHSCYALSGLAALQYPDNQEAEILGPESNKLERNCVFYNNCQVRVVGARKFFGDADRENKLGYEGFGVRKSYAKLRSS